MAWNRPNTANQQPKKTKAAPPSLIRGILAGLVVVVLCVVFYFMFSGDEGKVEVKPSKEPAKIKAEKPATPKPAPKVEKPAPKPKRYADMTNAEKLKSIRDKYGDNIPENMKTTVYFLEHPIERSFSAPKQEYQIFEHRSEEDIASLLVVEPGDYFLQKPFYDESFDRDFAKSLTDVIVVTDKDTPRQAEIKKAVRETKTEMAIRVQNGEKASDIMNAAVEQMYELGTCKAQVQELINDYHSNPEYSDDDIRNFVTAANKLLEQKGASPLKMPSLTMRQAKLRAQARREEAKRLQQQQQN